MFSTKIRFVFVCFYVSLGIGIVHFASAQSVSFYTDPSYSRVGSNSANATVYHEGKNSRWYVEDTYWNTLGGLGQANLLYNISKLSEEFDSAIYPKLTALFGNENSPGIDGDVKITVLILEMIEEAGGYMREQDGFSKDRIINSNEREMVYLNALHLGNVRAKAFLAHEFQHLITFNQKFITHNIQEEVWLNELRSEIASTILGYDDPSVYGGSNLEARTRTFLKTPSDAMLDWGNESKDYATINLFGQYLLDQYGRSVIAAMIDNDKVGIASFTEALRAFGFIEDFAAVFKNWTLAALINDCSFVPNTACYKNPSLVYNNFHVVFNVIEGIGKQIVSRNSTKDWQADWMKLEKKLETQKPDEHILMIQFYGPLGSNFRVPYVVYGEDGKAVLAINEMSLKNETGTFFVEEFGYKVPKVVIIPYNETQKIGTQGNAPTVKYTFNASTISEATRATYFAPATSTIATSTDNTLADSAAQRVILPNIPDGSLIRADNDYKVYIIKGGYKRWIQSADIFKFYGRLGFLARGESALIGEAVNVLPAETVAFYKDAWLVRAEGDYKVYEINGDGTRHWLDISAEKFSASGRLWDMVYIIDKKELSWYKEGPSVK